MLRVRVQYGKSLGKQKKTTEIETQTTIQVLHFSFPSPEGGKNGEIFISFRASFEAAPLRIVSTFSHRNGSSSSSSLIEIA